MCEMSFHQLHCITACGIKLDANQVFLHAITRRRGRRLETKGRPEIKIMESITARDDTASK
jgi:hypothetical protein